MDGWMENVIGSLDPNKKWVAVLQNVSPFNHLLSEERENFHIPIDPCGNGRSNSSNCLCHRSFPLREWQRFAEHLRYLESRPRLDGSWQYVENRLHPIRSRKLETTARTYSSKDHYQLSSPAISARWSVSESYATRWKYGRRPRRSRVRVLISDKDNSWKSVRWLVISGGVPQRVDVKVAWLTRAVAPPILKVHIYLSQVLSYPILFFLSQYFVQNFRSGRDGISCAHGWGFWVNSTFYSRLNLRCGGDWTLGKYDPSLVHSMLMFERNPDHMLLTRLRCSSTHTLRH